MIDKKFIQPLVILFLGFTFHLDIALYLSTHNSIEKPMIPFGMYVNDRLITKPIEILIILFLG